MIAPVRSVSAGSSLTAARTVSQRDAESFRVEPIAPMAAVRLDRRADFLAHLIATRDDLPQTRVRRRAEPAEAIAAYGRARKLDDAEVETLIVV